MNSIFYIALITSLMVKAIPQQNNNNAVHMTVSNDLIIDIGENEIDKSNSVIITAKIINLSNRRYFIPLLKNLRCSTTKVVEMCDSGTGAIASMINFVNAENRIMSGAFDNRRIVTLDKVNPITKDSIFKSQLNLMVNNSYIIEPNEELEIELVFEYSKFIDEYYELGEYRYNIIYFSGKNVANVVDENILQAILNSYICELYTGCIRSNFAKIKIEE